MTPIADNTAARNAIMDFRADHGASIPEHLRKRFRELSASSAPVDQMVGVGEFIWANRDQLGDEAKELAAPLIAYCTSNIWHGLADDGRGEAIVANLRKELGEIKTAPPAPPAALGYRVDPDAPEPAAPLAPAAPTE